MQQNSIPTAHNRDYSPVDGRDTLLQMVGIEVARQPHHSTYFWNFLFFTPNSIPTAHIRRCSLVGGWNTLLQTVGIEWPAIYLATSGNYFLYQPYRVTGTNYPGSLNQNDTHFDSLQPVNPRNSLYAFFPVPWLPPVPDSCTNILQ